MMYSLIYDGRCVLNFYHMKWDRAKTIITRYIEQFATEHAAPMLTFTLIEDSEMDEPISCDIAYCREDGRLVRSNYRREAVA